MSAPSIEIGGQVPSPDIDQIADGLQDRAARVALGYIQPLEAYVRTPVPREHRIVGVPVTDPLDPTSVHISQGQALLLEQSGGETVSLRRPWILED